MKGPGRADTHEAEVGMRFVTLAVLVGCGVGGERVEQGDALSFRSVEAVEGQLADCPEAVLDGLAKPAQLHRDGHEGTLHLLGEQIPVVFHDEDSNDPAGAFPEDFAQSYVVEGAEWWLVEVETPWNLKVTVDAGACAVVATYAP